MAIAGEAVVVTSKRFRQVARAAFQGQRARCRSVRRASFLAAMPSCEIRNNAMAGTLDTYQLSFEDGTKLQGKFLVQKLNYAGDFNNERSLPAAESSGAVVAA